MTIGYTLKCFQWKFVCFIYGVSPVRHNSTSVNDTSVLSDLTANFLDGSDGKESACSAEDLGSMPESGRSSGKGMATLLSILAWESPWTEEPGRLQSMGLHRVS